MTMLITLYIIGLIVVLGFVKKDCPDTPILLCLPAAVIWPLAVLWGIGAGLSKRVKP